ncbi:TetR/AcrR family transcriptional regulator [Couchioplanes azureus]|uniref:TetR/AcrR family transcriptional regulator n=1 Tax=Couchioplanes caeruleus TaxID=56438 RepID=UPI00167019E3|nr:TetR/AcrR family transcriptional regulator [Couchioplanes caeruleus]GGQ86239.1 TetR family transcriptional regulator [Couchioplanes caeruleus subsp. azureus]
MGVDNASGGPAGSLALLWGLHGRQRRRGRSDISVERIVAVAIEVADAEGLAAVSMRRIAEAVGVATMSLYSYVPGKNELVDLMLDHAYGEMSRPNEVPGGWRAKLELVARESWRLYRRHPWILQIPNGRVPLGPNAVAKYDYELRTVDGIGLSEIEMDSVVNLMVAHVESAARRWFEASQVEQNSGMTDQQWWAVNGPLLRNIIDESRFPHAARVGAVTGEAYGSAYEPEQAFEFGLGRVLDGIEVLVEQRAVSARLP